MSISELFFDPLVVQAGARLSGLFEREPDAEVELPLADDTSEGKWLGDVPVPPWPAALGSEILDAFAAAGLLDRVAPGRYRQSITAPDVIPAFRLYNYRDRESLANRFPQLVTSVRGRRVLDAGCGYGAYAWYLAAQGARFGRRHRLQHRSSGGRPSDRWVETRRPLASRFHRRSVLGRRQLGFHILPGRAVVRPPRPNDFRVCSRPSARRIGVPDGALANVLLAGHRARPSRPVGVEGSSPAPRWLSRGASFDLFHIEPRLRMRGNEFKMAYERESSLCWLLQQHGLELESWERGAVKPYVWIRKPDRTLQPRSSRAGYSSMIGAE